MDTNSDAREVAERALSRLLELRASQSPSIADVAAVASEVRVPSGSEFPARPRQTKLARRRGWRSARLFGHLRVTTRTIASDLAAFWRRAIDLTRTWLQAVRSA